MTKPSLQVLLDYVDVFDFYIRYDLEIGQLLLYPIKLNPLSYTLVADSAPEYLEHLDAAYYRLRGTVFEHSVNSLYNKSMVALRVQDFYFLWVLNSKTASKPELGSQVEMQAELQLEGYQFVPEIPYVTTYTSEYPQKKYPHGVGMPHKYYAPSNDCSLWVYQLYKVKAIQRYAWDEHAEKRNLGDFVNMTEGSPWEWEDYLITLEYQGENGLEAVNREIDSLGPDEYLEVMTKWNI